MTQTTDQRGELRMIRISKALFVLLLCMSVVHYIHP